MKKEVLKKFIVVGMIILAVLFMMGQFGVYAEDDLGADLSDDDIFSSEDDETKDDETKDVLDENNELDLPEEEEEEEEEINLTTPTENTNTNITLNNTSNNVEELPYTGTISNTVMVGTVLGLVAFGAYTLKKANDYKNI